MDPWDFCTFIWSWVALLKYHDNKGSWPIEYVSILLKSCYKVTEGIAEGIG